MNDVHTNFRPADDEPAVLSPALLEFVEAARNMPVPPTKVTIASIREGVEQQTRRRRYKLVAILGAAAALVMVVLNSGGTPGVSTDTAPIAERHEVGSTDSPTLGADIRITPLAGAEPVQVQDSRSVALGEGHYRVEVDKGQPPVTVRRGKRSLELVHGVIEARVSGQRFEAELQTGVAHWVTDAGQTPLSVHTNDPPDLLVRRAEQHMAAGAPKQAIATLEQLVASYPEHPSVTTAKLDLGRLYRQTDQPAKARCIYTKLRNNPAAKAVRPEVDRALARLGTGPSCP